MYFLRKTYSCSRFLTRKAVTKVATSNEGAVDYCANLVRQHDYENFLATLLMTKAIRTPALIVRAFNVEVARVQDQTSDVHTAALRLQFWHDALQNIYKNDQTLEQLQANPILQELFKICSCYKLPKRYLERLITSRSNLSKAKQFRTLEDVEKYAEDTVSSIYFLLLSIAGVKDVHADHAASHLGKAQGIVNILRSIHVSNHYKIVPLPMDILMQNKISQESLLRCVDSENMRNVIFEVASRANMHLQKARSINVPKICYQIFLPAVAIESYLGKLQKQHFNVFEKSLQRANVTLPLSLYFKRLMNKY